MNIDAFKANISNLAKSTLYRVTGASIIDQNFEFLCKAAQIPGQTLGLIEVPYMGRKIKIAGDRTFEDWTATILSDSDYFIRTQFEDWSNQINGNITNISAATIAEYKKDFTVEALDGQGNTVVKYIMKGCWPQTISAIDLSYDSVDTPVEWSLTLSFDEWDRV